MPLDKPPPRPSHYFTPQPLLSQHAGTREPHWVTARARGCTLESATADGMFARDGLDAGSRLLIETAVFAPDTRICDLGCGWGAVGCFAATLAPQSRVWMCDINLRAAGLAHFNLQHHQLGNAAVWCGDGLSAVPEHTFDTILCNPPVRAGNAVIARLFSDAERCLVPGGALWVVLRTAQGAKSWQRRLAEQFGDCATPAMKHGYRILQAIKPQAGPPGT